MNTMSSNSATRGATQQSIKAYVDGMRPKYVTATAGTLALTLTNRSADAVYNIADFTRLVRVDLQLIKLPE